MLYFQMLFENEYVKELRDFYFEDYLLYPKLR